MDEIGETTPRMQGLLLRFLETGEIQRVGSERVEARVNVRVIAATNRNLDRRRRGQDLPGGSVLPAQRHPAAHLLRCANALEDVPAMLANFLTMFAAQYQMPMPVGYCRCDGDAGVVQVAGERARVEERRRAAGRQKPQRRHRNRRPAAIGSAGRAGRRRPPRRPATSPRSMLCMTRSSADVSRSGRRSTPPSCLAI